MTDIDPSALPLETHPFTPYLPKGAKVLIMGTFPPQPKRWAMDFYYPNPTNDFWRIIGLIIYGDKNRLYAPCTRRFDLPLICSTLDRCGIALHDTGHTVRRLRDNASDKFLDIVTPVDLFGLLKHIPDCHTIASTGEKAAEVISTLTSTPAPRMGGSVRDEHHGLDIWRMPSTSRAYPLPLEQKAAYYENLFHAAGII